MILEKIGSFQRAKVTIKDDFCSILSSSNLHLSSEIDPCSNFPIDSSCPFWFLIQNWEDRSAFFERRRETERMERATWESNKKRSITTNEFLKSMHDPSVAEDAFRFLHFVLLLREALPLGWKGEGELFVPRKRALEESKFRRDNVVWTITKKFGQLEIFSFFPSNSSSSLLSRFPFSFFFLLFYDILKWQT